MSVRHYCTTKNAIILLAKADSKGVYFFRKGESKDFPGILFSPKPLLGIYIQIVQEIEKILLCDDLGQHLNICPQFDGKIHGQQDEEISLYLVTLDKEMDLDEHWMVLPDLIRLMPKSKNRIKYLQVMQWLAGTEDVGVKIADFADMVPSDKD